MFWRWRKEREQDLDRELRSHIELEAEEQQDIHAARRTLGNLTKIKEEVREVWGLETWDRFRQDVKLAARMLSKNPGFTLAAILTLALGIGANTAMFTIVDRVVLRPLPFPQPHRLIAVSGAGEISQQHSLVVLRDGSRTADYGAYSANTEFNFTGHGEPKRLVGSTVSANLFSVLGERAFLGRTFESGEDEPGRDRLVLLSYALWQREFRGDPGIIDRFVTIDDLDRRVAGILPPDFQFPSAGTEIWIPMRIDRRSVGTYWWINNLSIVGRLKPDFTSERALAELRTFVPQIRDGFPPPWKMWSGWGTKAQIIDLQEMLIGNLRTRLLVLLAAVGLVLLIACANVANLLLARGASRQREISMRFALGATHLRVIRQLLTECLVLAAFGAAAGLGLAFALGRLFAHVVPSWLPQFSSWQIDARILLFAAVLAFATGIGFGLLPAIRFSKVELNTPLNSASRSSTSPGKQRLAAGLVAFEIAIGVVVVIGAGLLARSFWQLMNVNPGFRTKGTLTALITPNPSLCTAQQGIAPPRCLAFIQELLDRARALPGVEAAAGVNPLPLTGEYGAGAMEFEGHPVLPGSPAPTLWSNNVTPDYFQAMGIRILSGRGFAASDDASSEPVAVVTAATAERWWPSENPIGKHLRFVAEKRFRTVIGIAADTRELALTGEPEWQEGHMYLPYAQYIANRRMYVVLKTTGDPLRLAEPLRRLVAEIRADVPVTQIRTMDEVISQSVNTPRSSMWLLFSFAVLALLLSAVGVYAVVAYTVAQKTKEIGIRMALGARTAEIVAGVLKHSLAITSAGVVAGVAAAWAIAKIMRSLLFQVTPHDATAFIVTPAVIMLVAMLAAYIPARRASQVDPAVSLRYE